MEEIVVTDMHTGGMPLRIIKSGYPNIIGKTILEKRRYVRDNFDYLRTRLMYEPRGHFEQYGAILVVPDFADCDIGVIFIYNDGYSTMCGHACIALGRYVVDNNLHKNKELVYGKYIVTKVQCPCGVVEIKVEINETKTGSCSFTSVPAFAFATDVHLTTSYGEITLDIGYGGAFYGLVDITGVNLSFEKNSLPELNRFASEVYKCIKTSVTLSHPDDSDLSFLYGVILTDGKDQYSEETTENVCFFGSHQQVDRSPTGSGVTARLAVQHAKKLISAGSERTFTNGVTKSQFKGMVTCETSCGTFKAVRVQVTGHGYYTGTATFTIESNDPFKNGILIK